MDKRDKVLKGLDVCHAQYSVYYCSQCPYSVERNECMSMMHHHARDLLKDEAPQDGDAISRSMLLSAYDAAHKGPPGGARKLIEDAPSVTLEAKAPRVMKPGEIAALKENDIVWYEQHGPDGDYITAMVADGREFIGNASMGVKLRCMDESERLWTSRPTDAQRAAEPWEAVTS